MRTEFLPEKLKYMYIPRQKCWIKLEDIINVDIPDLLYEVI